MAVIDKVRIAKSFGRAAGSYDEFAELQKQVANFLLGQLMAEEKFERVLDIGSGTGYCTVKLRQAFPDSEVISLDIAEQMLKVARENAETSGAVNVCGDFECLPFKSHCFDLLVSSLAIQWSQDFAQLLRDLKRVTRPGGKIYFSTFGPLTLKEVKASWEKVDAHVHVNRFAEYEELLTSIQEQGFEVLAVERKVERRYYPGFGDLALELKKIGAHNMNGKQARGLTGKRAYKEFLEHLDNEREEGKGLPISFELFYFVLKV